MSTKKDKLKGLEDRSLSLAEAVNAGDARSAKAELKKWILTRQDESLEALPYLYADGVRQILSGVSGAAKQQKCEQLLFQDASSVRLYLDLLIDELCAANRKARHDGSVEAAILSYVDENIFDPELSLSMVAEYFNQQKSFVSTLYKREKGMNYVDYVNRVRIAHAAKLLRQAKEESSLDEVSLAAGYISQSTFRRNFIKYMGCKPGKYRRHGSG